MRPLLFALLLTVSPTWGADPAHPPATGAESVLFDSLPTVETAALYTQTLQEAPSNVTVVTRRQIRSYGFRTLAEVLSNVRGFYSTFDGDLYYAGVRGFAVPGDYNTRILVMLNGHYLADNVYGAMYMFGQDFGLDMDLIERIEIVRGPSSALYGSNGVFATINIFSRAPADSPRAYLATDVGSNGEQKMLISSSMYLGRGANLLIAGSGFHARGRRAEFAELGGLQVKGVGAEHGYHTFAQLTWRDWSVTANFQDRKAIVPTGWYATDFGDTGTSSRDAHNFVEAALVKPLGKTSEIRWRVSYDQYRYYGRYDSTGEDGVTWDLRDYARGDWLGTRFTFQRSLGRLGKLTLGGEANADLQNLQASEYVSPSYELDLERREPDHSYGLLAQQVWNPYPDWTVFAGIRFDDSTDHSSFVSPRIAAVWKSTATTSYKFMFGRAFRNPSTFEQYWTPNPLLEAEKVNAVEVAREQRISRRVDLIASVFHYRLAGLIEGVPFDGTNLQYQNVLKGRASGVEVEANGHPVSWLETSASFSLLRAKYTNPDRDLPNSPARLGLVRAAAPLFGGKVTVSGSARSLSGRGSPYGFRLPAVVLADMTATTSRLHRNFDLQLGVRNLANRQYADPLSTEHLTQVMPRAGRSLFFRVIWHHGEE